MNTRDTYTYDGEGRLATMNGMNLSFSAIYYADGTEAEGASNGGWTQDYVYDAYDPGGQYVLEPWGNQSGGYDAFELVGLGGRHIAIYNENNPRGTYFVHPNALGSNSNTTDWKGQTNGEQIYDPWGHQLVSGGQAIRFAGMSHRDQTGFDVTPNRDYSNTLDRWLTPDPGGKGAVNLRDPQTWNAYVYVRNNPTTLTDPTGLEVPASCAKDPNCTIVVKINVIYDQTVNRGKGLTPEQKQKFQDEQLAKAQKDYGRSNIKLDVTYTAGRFEVGANGNPIITGARSGYLNLVVSNGTSSGASGESFVGRGSGTAVSIVNINEAGEHNIWPLSMNTTEHEIGHQFLGHVYMPAGGYLDTFGKEFSVDNRLFGQTLGISQGDFRTGLEPRDYASPADGPDQ